MTNVEIVTQLLQCISDGIIPKADDYQIDPQKFNDIIDAMDHDNLIMNARLNRDAQRNVIRAVLTDAKLTTFGMVFLEEHAK